MIHRSALKAMLLLFAAGYNAGIVQAQTQIASFNLTLAPQTVAGWTNLHGDPSTTNLTVTDPTGIVLSTAGIGETHKK